MPVKPPPQKTHSYTLHNTVVTDEYRWMHNAGDADLTAYLEAEKEAYDGYFAGLKPLEEKIHQEGMSLVPFPLQKSMPVYNNGYWYYFVYHAGKKFAISYRCRNIFTKEAEEVVFDPNELAGDSKYFYAAPVNPSPDNRYILILIDRIGDVRFSCYVKDLTTGKMLAHDGPAAISSYVAWSRRSDCFYYARREAIEKGNRPSEIYLHKIDMPATADTLVYREEDTRFSLSLSLSKSARYVFITCRSRNTAEEYFIDQDAPFEAPQLFCRRRENVVYGIEDINGGFIVFTNYNAPNFRVMKADIDKREPEDWQPFIEEEKDIALAGAEVMQEHIALSQMHAGRMSLRVVHLHTGQSQLVPVEDELVTIRTGSNHSHIPGGGMVIEYTSFRTPLTQCMYDVKQNTLTVLRGGKVNGDYNPEDYEEQSLMAISADGTAVPLSLVYKKGIKLDGTNPVLMVGYGAYGKPLEPGFSYMRVSLLNRGFIFAHAHTRGGNEFGHQWYQDGKMLQKKNSIADFIACARHLVQQKYTAPRHLYISGGSAGGIVAGAAVNQHPELFNGVILQNAFLDVLNTMLDEKVPLTTIEFEEWGNPKEEAVFRYMQSYAPYENIRPQAYPHMLVLTGMHDHLVPYYEGVKWVARVKAANTGDSNILLQCDPNSGHFKDRGSFDVLKDFARIIAFLLHSENITA
jgi:oligopeptidase B